jgi:branched-subunit amino acid ABC-type transport system permease component
MWDDPLLIIFSVVTSGLLVGVIFAVVAAGLTLIHGTILLPQAANGQFFLAAGLLFWLFQTNWGWPSLLAAAATFAIMIVVSIIVEFTVLRRFYSQPGRSITYLIITLGISQIMAGIFTGTFGKLNDTFQIAAPVSGFAVIEPVPISYSRLMAFCLAISVLVGLIAFLKMNRLGRALRAVFQNREVAALRGIDTVKIYRFAFVLGTVVTSAGGIIYVLAFALDLSVGWTMSLITFAIMIVGGPGSVMGALCVSLVFGFTQSIVSVFADPTIATFAYLLAMLVMLLLKPSGLFLK